MGCGLTGRSGQLVALHVIMESKSEIENAPIHLLSSGDHLVLVIAGNLHLVVRFHVLEVSCFF